MRVVFMGSDPIALPLLAWLAGEGAGLARAEVVGVFAQPDRPSGRGQKAAANAIKTWALERGVAVYQPDKIGPADHEALRSLRPDVSLVMAYGHILRDDFIGIPKFGTLNLHASLLPAYRGASPIQTAIANGERETGVSLMRIVRALDAGPVADIERVSIGAEDTAQDVEARLAAACVPLLARTLPRLGSGTLAFAEQDAAKATYCRRLTKDDGVLDFAAPAPVLAARINGLFPWPSCAVEIGGGRLRLGGGRTATDIEEKKCLHVLNEAAPGETCPAIGACWSAGPTLRVMTGDGVLELTRLQRPGGRMLPAGEFLRGFPLAPGTRLASQPMPPLVSPRPFKH